MATKAASLTKSQKKAAKKQLKNRHTLFKRNGISPVDIPTHHLVVANGGLDNNVSSEELSRAFGVYGEVVDIVMQPQKSYAFVSMSSISDAEAAFTGLHGTPLSGRDSDKSPEVILYLDYVNSGVAVPSNRHPPGLLLLQEFVSELEERELLAAIDWEQVDANISAGAGGVLKHRRVKHYGYEFTYGINNVDRDRPLEHGLPAACDPVITRLLSAGHVAACPDQLTVNQYRPGQGIPPHVDTHSAFDDGIVSLSLGSQCVMEFTSPDGDQLSILLPRRSALVMSGESRYLWAHGITPRQSDIVPAATIPLEPPATHSAEPPATHHAENAAGNLSRLTLLKRGTRTSLTFRKIRTGPCICKYPEQCDSQQTHKKEENKEGRAGLQVPKSDHDAALIEKEHVHQVYEQIAGHFSDTRHTAWPRVAQFLRQQPEGAIVVDVGCGNGKYLGVNGDCFNVGCDRSANLCSICRQRGHPVFVADALCLPLRAGTADVAISIAVIHHLSTEERRRQAVQQIVQVLRPGGQALIYVWALEQEKDKVKSNYLKDGRIKRKDCLQTEEISLLMAARGTPVSPDDRAFQAEISSEPSIRDTQQQNTALTAGTTQNGLKSQMEGLCLRAHTQEDSSDGRARKEEGSTVTPEDTERTEPAGGATSGDAAAASACGGTLRGADLKVHVNRTHFEDQDVLVPWHSKPQRGGAEGPPPEGVAGAGGTGDAVVHRFYHVFQEGELEKLCLSVTGVRLINQYYDKGNWCVIIEKIQSL